VAVPRGCGANRRRGRSRDPTGWDSSPAAGSRSVAPAALSETRGAVARPKIATAERRGGERVPLDARRVSVARPNENVRLFGAPPAPHGADANEDSTTRAQKRAAGTKKTALLDMWRRGDVEMTMRQQVRRRAASAAC
jgi:hypothetical protein